MRIGAPGGIRTPDPQIRSLMLSSAELRAHMLWSGRPDSNRGPLPPHGSALAILRYAPTDSIIPHHAGKSFTRSQA